MHHVVSLEVETTCSGFTNTPLASPEGRATGSTTRERDEAIAQELARFAQLLLLAADKAFCLRSRASPEKSTGVADASYAKPLARRLPLLWQNAMMFI